LYLKASAWNAFSPLACLGNYPLHILLGGAPKLTPLEVVLDSR
jgi:hypothetical protein